MQKGRGSLVVGILFLVLVPAAEEHLHCIGCSVNDAQLVSIKRKMSQGETLIDSSHGTS